MSEPMWVDLEVGRVARMLRTARGLSLEIFAQKISEAPVNIEAIEEGRLRLNAELMFRYCSVLNVPIRVFFDWRDDKDPSDDAERDPMDGDTLLELVN